MDLSKFRALGQKELSIKSSRIFGVTIIQIGSTISATTTKKHDRFGFSALIKTPLGLLDFKIPLRKQTLDFKIFSREPALGYSVAFSPLKIDSNGFTFSLSRGKMPLNGFFTYNTKTKEMNTNFELFSTTKGTTFLFNTSADGIIQSKDKYSINFKQFMIGIHSQDKNGISLLYVPKREEFEYSSVVQIANFSFGLTGINPLIVNEKGIKFGVKPTQFSVLARGDFDPLSFHISSEFRIIPSLSILFRAEKSVPGEEFSAKVVAAAELQMTEDSDFNVSFQAGGSLNHVRWGSISARADVSGATAISFDPMFGEMIQPHGIIEFKQTKHGLKPFYSFNVSIMNVKSNKGMSVFEIINEYVHALMPKVEAKTFTSIWDDFVRKFK